MKYDLKKPCAACPFTRSPGAIRVRLERARQLAKCSTTFPCHSTVDYETHNRAAEQHCAGALLYAYKADLVPHQLARIAERLGILDMRALVEGNDLDGIVAAPEEMALSE